MKTLEEFRSFFETTLKIKLQSLEEERIEIVKQSRLITLAVISSVIAYFLVCYFFYPQDALLSIIIALVCWFAWGVKMRTLRQSYTPDFKRNIIQRIITFIAPDLNYSASRYISEDTFISSKLFTIAHDQYSGDDYVWGKTGETAIEFSEIFSQCRFTGGRGAYWYTIFKGLFFIGDFNKNFSGKTLVLPDKAERFLGTILGRFIQSRNTSRGELIQLENAEFEKNFVVYGDDQIEARYILSTSLMERIVEFKKKTGRQIYLSFLGSKIFVAISFTKDLFEPKLNKSVLDFKPLQEYYEDIQLAVSIVEDLNLNTRIWGK